MREHGRVRNGNSITQSIWRFNLRVFVYFQWIYGVYSFLFAQLEQSQLIRFCVCLYVLSEQRQQQHQQQKNACLCVSVFIQCRCVCILLLSFWSSLCATNKWNSILFLIHSFYFSVFFSLLLFCFSLRFYFLIQFSFIRTLPQHTLTHSALLLILTQSAHSLLLSFENTSLWLRICIVCTWIFILYREFGCLCYDCNVLSR